MSFSYKYPRPAVTIDAAVFRKAFSGWEILLIQRGKEPYLGMWALPGGFVDMDETLEQAVARELKEETGLEGINLEQLHTFSEVNRDPRHRTISTVYIGIIPDNLIKAVAGDDALDAKWFRIDQLPELAFDHAEVIKYAIQKLS
jgi:8-oxo-dGTP diphosphatase